MLDEAIQIAVEAHKGQVDKAGEPYILHPLRVMLMCAPECRIAAVLHDTVEDTGLELRLIGHRFGAEIAEAVDALTRREGENYTDFIKRCGQNEMARQVKMADLSDNMRLERLGREPTAEDAKRQRKYSDAYAYLFTAQGTEARRAETENTGSVHDGPVPQSGMRPRTTP
jgi:(p)ppGpp synthase/HD superfamily hydrolase